MSLIRDTYHRLPQRARRPLDCARALIGDTVANRRLPGYRVEGTLVDGSGRATVTLFGEDPRHAAWISAYFGTVKERECIGEASPLDVLLFPDKAGAGDVTLMPINVLTESIFRVRGWHTVPKYVDCVIHLDAPFRDLFRGKSARKEYSAFARSDYHMEELFTEKDLAEFYERFLLPTVEQRHGELAFSSSWQTLLDTFRSGALFGVFRNGVMEAGQLVEYENAGVARLANIGWRDGNSEIMKQGVHSGSMYETVRLLQERGFHSVNMGSCLPFPNDGPLNYKVSRFHSSIEQPPIQYVGQNLQGLRSWNAIRFAPESPAASQMLKLVPLFARYRRRLVVLSHQSSLRPEFQHQIDQGMDVVEPLESET